MIKRITPENTTEVPPEPTKTLSGVKSPQALKDWCQTHVKPLGRLCRHLHTASTFVKEKAGCDWEVANFILHELTQLGYEASVLFITRADHLLCQSSVVYRDDTNQWWWVLWSPDSQERMLICGGFKSINQLLATAKGHFEFSFDVIDYSKIGKSFIEPEWTFVEYLAMADQWPKAPRRSRQ